ncbi:unnamed protein product [Mytilus coruscus]|uniref:Uncharacterized protein n=1 Tax=Mytilus coruscus TaxID=42192 RepID=A0A6J8BZ63_MYTCO|nr:unnamed protein product [Mytilus coruscus]
MGAFCGCSGRPIELQPSRRCEAVQDLNFVMEKMECIMGKGHYMFDSEEFDTKPSAESTSDEVLSEYENTSLANMTSNTGLPAWVSSVMSSTIDWFIYIIVTIIAVSEVFLRGNQNLRRRLETIQVINYLKNLQNKNNLPQRHPEIHQLPQQQIEQQPNLMQNNHNLPQRHPEIQQLPQQHMKQQPNLRRSQRRRTPVSRLNL